MMLTLSSMPTAILREDIPLISGVQDAETSAIFSKSILPHFNFRTTSEKTGTHGTNVLAIWIG